MKIIRNIVLTIALVFSMQWWVSAQPWSWKCQDEYLPCKASADQSYEDCNRRCDEQWIPNTFEWDQCRSNCGAAHSGDVGQCQAAKNSCIGGRQLECENTCSNYCGQNNQVQVAQYTDDSLSCSCQCACNPSGRPSYCPGGPSAASCSGGGWACNSPVLISMESDRVSLAGPADGVLFDLHGIGLLRQWSWTRAESSDGWLALDRNGSGTIEDGTELFGSVTEQPAARANEIPHGFRALAVFDSLAQGGNEDGFIDARDAVFSQLRLWRDANQNGVSEPSELLTLTQADVGRLDLQVQERPRRDRFGNYFRYRARVWDTSGRNKKWAWDVFLVNP